MTLEDHKAAKLTCTRPRRLEPDTLAYLKEVNESLSSTDQELSNVNDEAMVIWNVLEEIASRAASAISDRHACVLVEQLLPRMNELQLRFLMAQMTPYTSHLWTNRYSSHVLQHILSKSQTIVRDEARIINTSDGAVAETVDGPECATDTPYMTHIIESMVRSVENEWISMMYDVSATHVFRSVLAVLSGTSIPPQRRGKKAKHKENAFDLDTKIVKNNDKDVEIPNQFVTTYRDIVMTVSALEIPELHELVCDRNACPFITTLIQLAPSQTRNILIYRILHWTGQESPNKTTAQIFYDLSGDSVASHFLETVLQNLEENDFMHIFSTCLQNRMNEFSEHKIANYVVQHALQAIPNERIALAAVQEMEPLIWKLLSIKNDGVIWRLVQLCTRFKLRQKAIVHAIQNALRKIESSKPTIAQRKQNWVASLLSLQLSTSSGASAHLSLNVLGAKIFFELMHIEDHTIVKELFESFFESMNTKQLTALARDASGSRYIIEPILENACADRKWIIDLLFEKFVGHFGYLATHRISVFTVMKCYQSISDLTKKEIIVKELADNESKLVGFRFAQHALQLCHVHEYKNDRIAWRALYERSEKISDLFQDVLESNEPKSFTKNKKAKRLKAVDKCRDPLLSKQRDGACDDVKLALKSIEQISKVKQARKD